MAKIRVLIIDDSALIRKLLTEILSSDPQLEVVGTAPDPFIARSKIKQLNPDVLTLDVEMPRMDGITFLSNLMRLRPMPVVMVSSLTQEGAEVTLKALELGAIDFVAKPAVDISKELKAYSDVLCEKVKTAATARVNTFKQKQSKTTPVCRPHKALSFKTTDQLIAIGASTGGVEAIKEVLLRLPANMPGIVIVQHIPGMFSKSFANRLNALTEIDVCEAEDGQRITTGCAYIAPGDRHLLVVRDGARYICKLSDAAPISRHKPSVDALFLSVAEHVGKNAIGVIMTGMGKDGSQGLLEMRNNNAQTIAQDEASSVVWGMPGEAIKAGAAEHIVPLSKISQQIMQCCSKELGNN